MSSRLTATKRTAIGALLLVLATTGCASKAASSTPSSLDTAAASPASSPAAEPSPTVTKSRKPASPTPTAVKKSKTPQKTKAPGGGGTKYPGCGDGDCKVSFSGSVKFALADWTVSASVEDGGVRVRTIKPNGLGGGGGFLAGPGCNLAMHADGGGRLGCEKPEGEPKPGGYLMHVLELNGSKAVLRAALG